MKFITEPQTTEPTCIIKTGLRFKNASNEYEYILAQTGHKEYNLINLTLGSRWSDAKSLEKLAETLNDGTWKLL